MGLTESLNGSRYEGMATLFEILAALDHLERLFLRDAVPEKAYTEQCNKLLNNYEVSPGVACCSWNIIFEF